MNKTLLSRLVIFSSVLFTVFAIAPSLRQMKSENRQTQAGFDQKNIGTMKEQNSKEYYKDLRNPVSLGVTVGKFRATLQQRRTDTENVESFTAISDQSVAKSIRDTILVGSRAGQLFLQAPHQYADKHTGDIARALSKHQLVDALFLNKRHRRDFDYSHQTPNLLSLLSQTYLEETVGGLIVQLHGFSKAKRQSEQAKSANFILSSGSKRQRSLPRKLRVCLLAEGFTNVEVFGDGVDELGATTNLVKKNLHSKRLFRFLHIEMSLSQRRALLGSVSLQHKFMSCFSRIG